MAPKKKPVKKQSVKRPLVKQILPKVTVKPKRKKRATKNRRVNLPRPSFLSAVWGGQTPDGRSVVHVNVDPEEHIDRLVITVNGRGVWEGQP